MEDCSQLDGCSFTTTPLQLSDEPEDAWKVILDDGGLLKSQLTHENILSLPSGPGQINVFGSGSRPPETPEDPGSSAHLVWLSR